MNTNSATATTATAATSKARIIDVREPKEYRDGHIPESINLPSTRFQHSQYTRYASDEIYLICQTGRRAGDVYTKLKAAGFDNVHIMNRHIEEIHPERLVKSGGWTVDRQFRMTLGVFLALFLIGHFSGLNWAVAIPIILSTGLIVTSIIDRCYMRMAIASLPWNKGKTE